MPNYDFELIIADNASKDDTREIIRNICQLDIRVKAIFNTRNFGPERSGINAFIRSTGVATVGIASDLQEPPEMIERFIEEWESGAKIVGAIKNSSDEHNAMRFMRTLYYKLMRAVSSSPILEHFTGFGLYDKIVVQEVKKINDPNPFFRGIIADLGYNIKTIDFKQHKRKRGRSTYNLISLTNHGVLGLISQTQVPIRVATILGLFSSVISFVIGVIYLILKIFMWDQFNIGIAPITVGLFFFSSIQLLFLGIIGEYIGSIKTKITRLPLVVEDELINF